MRRIKRKKSFQMSTLRLRGACESVACERIHKEMLKLRLFNFFWGPEEARKSILSRENLFPKVKSSFFLILFILYGTACSDSQR